MPKRGSEDEDYSILERKIRKLEKKLKKSKRSHRSRSRARRRRRLRSISSHYSSGSPPRGLTPQQGSEDRCDEEANNVVEVTLIDEPIASTSADVAIVSSAAAVAASPALVCSDQSQVTPPLLESNIVVTPTNTETVSELDNTILEILGIDPTQQNSFGAEIQKELAVRLEHYATNGLTKENRKELKEQYLIPSNCKLINAPLLNAELKAALTDMMINRDKAIEMKQVQLASAISALGQALTRLFSAKDRDAELIKTLMDTSRILCDCQYSDSMRRRGFVLSSLRKDVKDPLQSSTKIDNYLFGQGLAETLKATKAINKSSTDLKATPAPKPPINKKPTLHPTRPLNWKGPFQTRRQPEPPRTKEPAPTKYRQLNASRSSQHRPQPSRRR